MYVKRLLNEELTAKNKELQTFRDLIAQITNNNNANNPLQIPNPFCNQLILPIQSTTTNNIIFPQITIGNMQIYKIYIHIIILYYKIIIIIIININNNR